MESRIAQAINMTYQPVAVLFTNEKPDDALQFTPGRWGGVIAMLTRTISEESA